MVTAISLLKVDRNRVNEVAQELVDLEGVSEVYSVAGRYDQVAIIRVQENEDLREVATDHMLKIDGIEDSETLFAFEVHSKHELESMFSIGFE
jgi:DNA-binding Lrp family transcriptional regulator